MLKCSGGGYPQTPLQGTKFGSLYIETPSLKSCICSVQYFTPPPSSQGTTELMVSFCDYPQLSVAAKVGWNMKKELRSKQKRWLQMGLDRIKKISYIRHNKELFKNIKVEVTGSTYFMIGQFSLYSRFLDLPPCTILFLPFWEGLWEGSFAK